MNLFLIESKSGIKLKDNDNKKVERKQLFQNQGFSIVFLQRSNKISFFNSY